MKPLDAPGSDGFSAQFFKKHWPIVGKEICHFILAIPNQKCPLESVNQTFINLIPKVKDTQKLGEFRPIGLCNIICKLVAKVLANRLKLVLPEIISPT